MKKLFEMGFWNEPLNQQLLTQNKMDIERTVEKLLESSVGIATETASCRSKLSMEQIVRLLNHFLDDQNPCKEKMAEIGEKIGLSTQEVEVWFENRRKSWKRDQEDQSKKDSTDGSSALLPPPPANFGQDYDRFPFLDFD